MSIINLINRFLEDYSGVDLIREQEYSKRSFVRGAPISYTINFENKLSIQCAAYVVRTNIKTDKSRTVIT